jgi:hypothetical protein
LRFEYDNFEHEDDIEVRSSAVGLRLAQHGKKRTKSLLIKHGPIDIGGEAFEETIELVEFIGIGLGRNQIRLHRLSQKRGVDKIKTPPLYQLLKSRQVFRGAL